jgi:hypothetical protein
MSPQWWHNRLRIKIMILTQRNSYRVTFVFEHTVMEVDVLAENVDSAPTVGSQQIYEDLGFNNLSSFLEQAQEVNVELLWDK